MPVVPMSFEGDQPPVLDQNSGGADRAFQFPDLTWAETADVARADDGPGLALAHKPVEQALGWLNFQCSVKPGLAPGLLLVRMTRERTCRRWFLNRLGAGWLSNNGLRGPIAGLIRLTFYFAHVTSKWVKSLVLRTHNRRPSVLLYRASVRLASAPVFSGCCALLMK
jgi:hypothetical protein